MTSVAPHPSTRVLFSTGDSVDMEGMLEEVEKPLQNAARSSLGTLASAQGRRHR
jgi:hypothetical protein